MTAIINQLIRSTPEQRHSAILERLAKLDCITTGVVARLASAHQVHPRTIYRDLEQIKQRGFQVPPWEHDGRNVHITKT